MKLLKQTVYLPVKVEDELPNESANYHVNLKYNGCSAEYFDSINDRFVEEDVAEWLKQQKLFVFTPEQLNEYTQSVIKQALETAAKKVEIHSDNHHNLSRDFEYAIESNKIWVPSNSITNTFEETFKKFEV